MKCLSCKQELPDGAVYCAYCGANATTGDAAAPSPATVSEAGQFIPASRGKRFANTLVDMIVLSMLTLVLGISTYYLGGNGATSLLLYDVAVPFAYYFIFEVVWSKTPGKFLTKTHVVSDSGEKASASHLAIRTISRWIPFEAFSYLFKPRPRGWHDRISNTTVVDDK